MYFCCISAESEFQKTTATVTVSAGLLLTAIDRIWGNCYRRARRYSLVSGMTAEKSIPLSRISRMISRTAWRCSLSAKAFQDSSSE